MQASLLEPAKINATILSYCRMETDVERLKQLSGPVLAIYAQQERNWPQKQDNFEAAMKAAGKVTQSVDFNTAHSFTNPASPHYDEETDKASWAYIVSFLQRYLVETPSHD